MADRFPHLSKKAAEQAVLSAEERIEIIRLGSWIPYQRAEEILARMEDLLAHPKITRMPNMLLVGASNNGKTSILERFRTRHATKENETGEESVVPVVSVEAPGTPDVEDLYRRILDALFAPYRPSSPAKDKYHQITALFPRLGVRLLVIDEIHHLIAGSLNRQREFRNAIKSLGNETQVCIVAAGIEDAFNAFNTDPQLSNRFVPEILPKWSLDGEFARLLKTLEHRTPLREPSNLADSAMAQKILWMSEGTIGDTSDLVKATAIAAIRQGTERITVELLDKLGWVQPSLRSRRPPQL
ncbi:MAG: TniB family NTP-binding protein [Acidobacteriia bacterium]|nr:TniB family NTP-binding protein [Terriglobia bacterium]